MLMPNINIGFYAINRPRLMILDLDPSYPNEETILKWVGIGEYYEPEVSRAMIQIVEEGDVVVDIGANAGFFTVLLGTLTGPGGRVMSFEPSAANIRRLKNNIALNELANVNLVEQPASHTSEEIEFYINSDDSGGNALWDVGTYPTNLKSAAHPIMLTMKATTIDDEFERLSLPTPKLIKVDTEGAEEHVLRGCSRLLSDRKVRFVIAELHEFGLAKMGGSQKTLHDLMEGLGYSTFGLYYDGSMPKLIPQGTQITMPCIINLLFSTQEAVARHWPTTFFHPAAKAP